MNNGNISNDFGKVPRNNLNTLKIISLSILVVILTIIIAYIFFIISIHPTIHHVYLIP
jgi:hypothetical protein